MKCKEKQYLSFENSQVRLIQCFWKLEFPLWILMLT